MNKGRVADAVHRAVCDFEGTDGAWRCNHYAHAGHGLLMHLGIDSEILAGDLDILDEGCEIVESLRYTGADRQNISGHVWLRSGGGVIDLAARHYGAYAGPAYRRLAPNYVWGDPRRWGRYIPLPAATAEASVVVAESLELHALAINHYEGRDLYRAVRYGRTRCGMVVSGLERN